MPAMSREASEILFLLGEMRGWVATGRISVDAVAPLYAAYAARMVAGGYDVPPLPAAPVPAMQTGPDASAPDRSPSTAQDAWPAALPVAAQSVPADSPVASMVAVGAGESNPGKRPSLSALQVVGAILLVGGVFSIVALHWETIGSVVLPWILIGLSLGMTELGRRQEDEGETPTSRVLRSIGLLLRPTGLQVLARTTLALPSALAWTVVGGIVIAWSLLAGRRGSRTVEPLGVWLGWACMAVAGPVAVSGTFQPLATALLLAASQCAYVWKRSHDAGAVESGAWWIGAAAAAAALQLVRTPPAGPLAWIGEIAVDVLLVGAVAGTARGMASTELHGLAAALIPLFALATASKALPAEPTARIVAAACLIAGMYLDRIDPARRLGRWGWYGLAAATLFVDLVPTNGPTLGGGLVLVASGILFAVQVRAGHGEPSARLAMAVLVRGMLLRVLSSAIGPVPAAIAVDSVVVAGLFALQTRWSSGWSKEANLWFTVACVVQVAATAVRIAMDPGAFVVPAMLQSAAVSVGLAALRRPTYAAFAVLSLLLHWGIAVTSPGPKTGAWIALGLVALAALLPGNPLLPRMGLLQGATFIVGAWSGNQSLRVQSYTAIVLLGLMAHLPGARPIDRAVAMATGWIPLALWTLMNDVFGGRAEQPGMGLLAAATVGVAVAGAARRFPGAWWAVAGAIDLAAGVVSNAMQPIAPRAWFWWGAGMLLGAGLLPWTARGAQGEVVETETRDRTWVAGAQQTIACVSGMVLFGSGRVAGFLASIAAGAVVLLAGGRRQAPFALGIGVVATLLPPNLAYLDDRLDILRLFVLLVATVLVVTVGMVRRWRACLV
ncbi:MAG: hypothetical protein ACKO5K_14085, partial [Armatimonadota bacterium]